MVNERPDLFGCVVAQVPFVDVLNTMLDDTLPLTTMEYNEWGNPNDAEYYRYMRTYSPYDNVREQDYPPMLVTGGISDRASPTGNRPSGSPNCGSCAPTTTLCC